MVGSAGTAHEPFLDKEEAAHRSIMQRAAGSQLPDPAGVLLLFGALAGCACFAEATAGDQGEAAPGLAISLTAAEQPGAWSSSTLVLLVGAAVLWLALATQFIFEKLLARAASQAVSSMLSKCLDFPVELGRMRVWVFLGRVELRNCSMRNAVGYKGKEVVRVSKLTASFDVPRCLSAVVSGGIAEIGRLTLQGVEVVVEEGHGSWESNLQHAIAQLEEGIDAAAKPAFSVGKVLIKDVAMTKLGAPGRTKMQDSEFGEIRSEKMGSVNQAVVECLKWLEKVCAQC